MIFYCIVRPNWKWAHMAVRVCCGLWHIALYRSLPNFFHFLSLLLGVRCSVLTNTYIFVCNATTNDYNDLQCGCLSSFLLCLDNQSIHSCAVRYNTRNRFIWEKQVKKSKKAKFTSSFIVQILSKVLNDAMARLTTPTMSHCCELCDSQLSSQFIQPKCTRKSNCIASWHRNQNRILFSHSSPFHWPKVRAQQHNLVGIKIYSVRHSFTHWTMHSNLSLSSILSSDNYSVDG